MVTDLRAVARRLRGDGRGWVLLAVAAGWLFILGSRFLVPAVLPQVKDAFGVGNTGGGIAITIIWITYGIMQAPAGVLTDRIGERRLLAGSLLLSAASAVVLGIVPAFLGFLVGCSLFGFATGLYGPARGMTLSRTFGDDDGAAIGATLAAGSVGSAVLPFVAGALVGNVGWRYIVASLCPLFAVAGVFAWWAVPEHDAAGASGTDRADGADGTESPAAREIVWNVLRAVRIRGVAIAITAMTLMTFVFQALSAFFVTYFVDVKGLDQQVAAGLFALLFVGAAVSQLGGGVLADRIGARWVLTATAAVGTVSVAAVPFVADVLPVAALSLVLGSRLAVIPVTNAYIIAVLPDSVTGAAWGTLRTALFLIGSTGSSVVGVMADRGLFDEAFLLLAGITGVATLLYAFLPSRAAAAS